MPSADRVTPVPAIKPARDVADSKDVRASSPRTPTPPRWIPLTALTPISSPVRDFRSSREEAPVGLQADLSASTRPLSVPPQPSPSRTSPCDSLGESCEGEEGQFDDTEEGEPCTPPRLHPSEQLLPPSPSPSPSQVDQLVRRILELKHSVAASPDAVDTCVAAELPEAPLCPKEQGSTNKTPVDTSNQGEKLNASHAHSDTVQPLNVRRVAVVKQLFAPRGAFAALRMVCPSPVARKHAKELTTLEPSTLPPLLLRTYIRPMTIDTGHLSPPSPAPAAVDPQDTKIRAALDQVTPAPARLTVFADQSRPTELLLPKPYSLPRTLPVTPVLDEAPIGSPPSPMDSENDLPLNSIPVAEILPEGASLTTVIFSGRGPRRPGSTVKLLVSTPKQPRRRYGRLRNQR